MWISGWNTTQRNTTQLSSRKDELTMEQRDGSKPLGEREQPRAIGCKRKWIDQNCSSYCWRTASHSDVQGHHHCFTCIPSSSAHSWLLTFRETPINVRRSRHIATSWENTHLLSAVNLQKTKRILQRWRREHFASLSAMISNSFDK